ncbi:DUF1244 domain-containing protein [Psychrobium sp. MM17-31]|uniref:DUF1244 domain-containing protein n=1 Tax=Psychrobium sp. MM17-31 TaxID=2917758 RepID=UPI001EF625FB|nr:DUF1244 domain-containing protein [Psychrobium sp. MM17-31]MCG7530588.1 DUF1244 domain-containing protein [Psychrobium sp. MM17-31]
MNQLDQATQDALDAATFRRLLKHLDDNKDVQNIDLMILADFCRNCLGKWYKTVADEQGVDVSDEEARERVYGMPYSEWKANHQLPATQAQLDAFNAKKK